MFAVFLVALVACVSYADGSCPDGWFHHINRCYHFSHDAETMPIAAIVCKTMGGLLAEIEDVYENNYLTSYAKMRRQNFWIGLHDMLEEGKWTWYESNRSLNATGFSDWYTNQPDNKKGEEHCAFVDGNGHWEDGVCHSGMQYICEKTDTATSIVG